MGAEHPLVARDVILGHVGELASESSTYTLYGIPNTFYNFKDLCVAGYTHSS